MSKRHPTAPAKPSKPYPDFPLFPHWNGSVGRWAKKVRGKTIYFGPWDDPDGALKRYLEQKDDLHAGRKPRDADTSGDTRVKDMCNAFLDAKEAARDSGELSPRTLTDYEAMCG